MGGGKARGPAAAGLARMLGLGGGMPSPEEMQKLAAQMPGGIPGSGLPGARGLPPTMPGLPPTMPGGGLPGLGKFPGLGGKPPTPGGLPPDFPGLGKKK
jgi:signal recognition particle subunit SRP54